MKQVIDIRKWKTNQEIQNVANHNLRKTPSRNVVKSRTPQNKFYIGSPDTDVLAEIEERLQDVPKYRKDAVRVVHLVLSGSPDFFKDKKKAKEWEEATQKWLEDTFGKKNLIYSVVHHDEKTPHFHVCFTPIFEGKLRASHWFDGPAKLKIIHDSYAEVNKKFGLKRGQKSVKSKQTELEDYYKKVNSSTQYDRHLDKKLDSLFDKIENPTFTQKLNPWAFINDVIKPTLMQFKENLSHYRTKSEKAKEDLAHLGEMEQRVADLEWKFSELGIDPNTPFLELQKYKIVKPNSGIASAPQGILPKNGFDFSPETVPSINQPKKPKIH